jgi:hypothetical protein
MVYYPHLRQICDNIVSGKDFRGIFKMEDLIERLQEALSRIHDLMVRL